METRELHWLELMKHYGTTEIPGPVHNTVIVNWFSELGFNTIKDDETAWCALVANITAKHAGLEYTGKLSARSFMNIGKTVLIGDVNLGHVVVFYRGAKTGWQGHIGLFAGWSKDKKGIYTLGGNQGNKLTIMEYPVMTNTFGLLGFRELSLKK